MAFNEFDRPLEAQPIQTYVSQHVALPFKEYRAAIQDKQNQFDEEASRIEQDEASFAKVRAMQHDVAYRGEKEAEYQDRINKAVEKHKGDLVVGSQDFKRISKDLQYDLTRGALGAMDKKVAAAAAFEEDLKERQKGENGLSKESVDLARTYAYGKTQPIQRSLGQNEEYNTFNPYDLANYANIPEGFEKEAEKVRGSLDSWSKTGTIYDPATGVDVVSTDGAKTVTPQKIFGALMTSFNGNSKYKSFVNDFKFLNHSLKNYEVNGQKADLTEKQKENQEQLDLKIASKAQIEPWEYYTDPEDRKIAILAWGTAKGFAVKQTEESEKFNDAGGLRLQLAKEIVAGNSGALDIKTTVKDVVNPLGSTREDAEIKLLQTGQQVKSSVVDNLNSIIQNAEMTAATKGAASTLLADYKKNPDLITTQLIDGTIKFPGLKEDKNNEEVLKLKELVGVQDDIKQRDKEITEKAKASSGFNSSLYVNHTGLNTISGLKGNLPKLLTAYINKTIRISPGQMNSFIREALGDPSIVSTPAQADEINKFLKEGQEKHDKFVEHKKQLYTNGSKIQVTTKYSTKPSAPVFDSKTGQYKQDHVLADKVAKTVTSYLSNPANLTNLTGGVLNLEGSDNKITTGQNLGAALLAKLGGKSSDIVAGTPSFNTIGGKHYIQITYQNKSSLATTTFNIENDDLNIPDLTNLGQNGNNKAVSYIDEISSKGIEKNQPIKDNPNFLFIFPQDSEYNGRIKTKDKSKPYCMINGEKTTLTDGQVLLADYYEAHKNDDINSSLPSWSSLLSTKATLNPNTTYTYKDPNGQIIEVLGSTVINFADKKQSK